jgi:hypothetical protein
VKEWLFVATDFSVTVIDGLVGLSRPSSAVSRRSFHPLTGMTGATCGFAMFAGWSPASHSSSLPTFLKPPSPRLGSRRPDRRDRRHQDIPHYFLERDLGEIRQRQGAGLSREG